MTSLRKKIGQLLIIGFSGVVLTEDNPVVEWLTTDGLGGVILFNKDLQLGQYGKNIVSKAQVKHLVDQLNHYAAMSFVDNPLPLFTAIDYEGGAVDRLSKLSECPPTMKALELANLNADTMIEKITLMAQTLQELGFNLNFAPVVDLHLNDQEGIIGKLGRSFSSNPEEVTRIAQLFVSIFAQHGIASSYKHFPGHGSAIGDTHEGFVDVTNSFRSEELTPYYKLTQNKNWPVMIMTAHVINKHLDSSGIPATLSYKILTELLRDTMGFEGVIVSDDLQMQAIAHHYSMEEALNLTLNAGADMVIIGNQLGTHTAVEVIDCIERLVLDGKIPMERIEQSYKRVITLKEKIN